MAALASALSFCPHLFHPVCFLLSFSDFTYASEGYSQYLSSSSLFSLSFFTLFTLFIWAIWVICWRCSRAFFIRFFHRFLIAISFILAILFFVTLSILAVLQSPSISSEDPPYTGTRPEFPESSPHTIPHPCPYSP